MVKGVIKVATCCLIGSVTLLANSVNAEAISLTKELPVAGITGTLNECYTASTTADAQIIEYLVPTVQSEYADIAIAQVTNYVNCRSLPSEEGEVVGKLYDNSAATILGVEGEWYRIQSGKVDGYVKTEFVVTGEQAAELAKIVGRRVAVVNTTTLKVRQEPSTESIVLGLVPIEEELDVTEELDGWVKVSIEEGEGYVSTEFVDRSTIFVQAESKEEEEARLAKEEAERQAAAAAAEAAKKQKQQEQQQASQSSSQSSSSTPAPAAEAAAPAPAPSSGNGQSIANYALQFVGNPYVFGGASLTNGADCSGFVMSVYSNFGVSLPHSSSAMRGYGYEVGLSEAQPGDIVCYSGHVGIYIGNNSIVHASTSATGIKITSPANYRNVISVRRIY